MEIQTQENILSNADKMTPDFIVQLLNIRNQVELEDIFYQYCRMFDSAQSLLFLLVDKKSKKKLIEVNVGFPSEEKMLFEKNMLNILSLDKTTDDSFPQYFPSLDFYSTSYGLSLFCDRNVSVFRTSQAVNSFGHNPYSIKELAPYIHAALNNVWYHERVKKDRICLSCREKQVIKWVARGKTNKEIGMILQVSQFTIKNHIANIYDKLNVVNRAQAIETVIRLDCLA